MPPCELWPPGNVVNFEFYISTLPGKDRSEQCVTCWIPWLLVIV